MLSISSRPRTRSSPSTTFDTQSAEPPADMSHNSSGLTPVIALAGLAGGAAIYHLFKDKHAIIKTTQSNGRDAFISPIRAAGFQIRPGQQGARVSDHLLLSDQAIEDKLHQAERTRQHDRPGNPLTRIESNVVAGNENCEDVHMVDIVSLEELQDDMRREKGGFWEKWFTIRAKGEAGKGKISEILDGKEYNDDLVLASVVDGHGGIATAELLRRTLHPSIAHGLAKLSSAAVGIFTADFIQRISETFVALDDSIINAPIQLFKGVISSSESSPVLPSLNPALLQLTGTINSGAAAVTAILDVKTDHLHVANAGDCRAVAGWYNHYTGEWRCDPLSDDLTSENPAEADMIRSKHPESERHKVIFNKGNGDRVLGGKDVARCFGDAHYKISVEDQNLVGDALGARCAITRMPEHPSLTPPYSEGRPEISTRKVHPVPASGEQLRFVILASDGLWDRLSSEEATLLAAAYLEHPSHADIPKALLPQQFPLAAVSEPRPYPAQEMPGQGSRSRGGWVFEGDKTIATHLIRNMFGDDRELRKRVFSASGGNARNMRDDVTVV
ncbi:pyruvate dehydrogenase phosphatase, partial [Tremellales sp. Uapishka_1]